MTPSATAKAAPEGTGRTSETDTPSGADHSQATLETDSGTKYWGGSPSACWSRRPLFPSQLQEATQNRSRTETAANGDLFTYPNPSEDYIQHPDAKAKYFGMTT